MAVRLDVPRWVIPAAFILLATATGGLAGINPQLAIGATLGIAFILVAFGSLAAGLTAFTFISFLEFALPAGAASLTKGAGLLLALAWLARVATNRGDERIYMRDYPGATYLLLAFLGWGALSVSWSETTSGTLTDLSRYLLNFSLLVITYTAIHKREQVIALLLAWIAGTAFTAAYGLVSNPTSTADARLESTVGNANVLATILVAGMVLAIAIALVSKRSPLLRLAATGTAALAMFSFVFTGSRSGVLALGAAVVAAVLFAGPRYRMQALGGAIVLGITALVFFAAFAPTEIKDRIAQTVPGQVPDTEGRSTIWQVGWRMAKDNPVRGVGLGSFQTSSIHYVLEPGTLERADQIIDTPKVAHNIYLQALAELGVIGLGMFCAILFFPVWCALRAARNFLASGDQRMEIIARALAVALVSFLVADFFASEQFNKLLWLLLALGPVLLSISVREPRDPATA